MGRENSLQRARHKRVFAASRPRDKPIRPGYKNRKFALKENSAVFAILALLGTVVLVTLLNMIEFGRGD